MKKFYMALVAAAMTLSANANYYLVGSFTGQSWALAQENLELKDAGDGTYACDVENVLPSLEFKVNDGTWSGVNLGSNGSKVDLGIPYNMVSGSNSNITINITEPLVLAHFVFNPSDNSITVTGESGEVKVEYSYDLWGNWDGGKDWSAITLTEQNGKWVSSEVEVAACEFGVRPLANGSQSGWYSAVNPVVVLDTPMELSTSGSNFQIAAGTYTFTLDMEALTLTVTGKGGGDVPVPPTPPTPSDEVPAALYCIGNLSVGQWATTADGVVALTKEGNVFTGNVTITDPGYFSFITVTGEDWNAVNSGDRYGASAADEEIRAGVAATLTAYPANVSASAAASWKAEAGEYKVTVDFDNMTVLLETNEAGVAGVEVAEGEAVYYNLQGVQVANPAAGVYVKVVNGKATKVVVK
ncbi:MAG: hypothetical protein K2L83_04690 [Muribaculaceae bacterium]|nr:hypothetical protein [Muribaculaceae bacterium]